MKCNQWVFCLDISGYSTLKNPRQSKEFHSLVFYLAICANSRSQILQNRRHPMKCNQWGFCLGISGYSTLQNRRHSKEFCSLVFTSQFILTAHQKYCKTVDTLRNTINGAFAQALVFKLGFSIVKCFTLCITLSVHHCKTVDTP